MEGENVTPDLLMLVVQLVAEEMLDSLKDISADTINRKHENSNRKMKLHNLKDITSMTKK